MKNHTAQTGIEADEAAPSTELADRLLLRRTEPLGVIDVRRPQRLYARTAGWVAQRFALLAHWKRRYGADEDAGAANASLVFASPGQPTAEPGHTLSSSIQLARAVKQTDSADEDAGAANASLVFASPGQPTAEPGHMLSSSIQLARAVKQTDASQTRTVTAVSAPPPEQFRIRRRAAPPASSFQAATLPGARFDSDSPADGAKATSGASDGSEVTIGSQAERGEIRAAEMPAITPQIAPAASRLAGALILPQPLAGGVKAEPETPGDSVRNVERSSQRGETPSAAVATPARTPVRVSRMKVSPSALPLRLQRTPDEALTGLARVRELTAPPVSTATAQMRLSESAASQLPPSASPLREPPSLSGGDGATREAADSVAERTGLAGIGASLTRVESPSSLPLVQRQPAGGARVVETLSKPVMVWRPSAEGSSSGGARSALPLAISAARGGEPRVARQSTTAESTSSTNTESTPPVATTPMPAGPSASEIDVVHLAEHVSRLIARQLAVERERRGRSGWR